MEKTVSDLFEICARYLGRRFESLSGVSGASVEHVENEAFYADLYANRRSEIFVYGTDVTIRFQLFYNKDEFKPRINHLYSGGATDQKTDDFFNELGNMICGRVKQIMVLQGVNAALSLPVAVKFSEPQKQFKSEVLTHISDYVVKKGQEMLFATRVSLAIHKREAFRKFDPDFDEKSENNSEAEFF